MGIVVIRQLSKLLKSMFLHKEVTFSKDFQRQKSNQQPKLWFGVLNFQEYLENGGRYRARTSDPLLVRQVLSQLS